MQVRCIKQSARTRARVLEVTLPSGRSFLTPAFVPVGTNTLLKTVPPSMVQKDGPKGLIFVNTYHMMVQPGIDAMRELGGLHKLFGCGERPLITDSGGFQVFSLNRKPEQDAGAELKGKSRRRFDSLPSLRGKVNEEGVMFRSYKDGSMLHLTPESSIEAQQVLGADIVVPLDELLPQNVSERKLRDSFERTHRWQARSLQQHHAHGKGLQSIYGIVHGGSDYALRAESVARLLAMPGGFDGLAIGGSLGKSTEEMRALLDKLELPAEKPRHLLGIGDPKSLRSVVAAGMDTFDSVFPTRAARHGSVFILDASRRASITVKITNRRFRLENGPLDPQCTCATCTSSSAALMHHLAKCHDTAVGQMLTIHNVHVMQELAFAARHDIMHDCL